VQTRTRIALLVAAALAVVGFVVALALWDSAHPLRYLRADRVVTAQAWPLAAKGRAGRDLSPAEIAELCRLLAAGRSTEPVDTLGAVRIELVTMDFGRVEIDDLSGPGARAALFVGTGDEKRATLRSAELGKFLKALAADVARSGNGNNNNGIQPQMNAD
jgi:hypothetical protein